MRTLNLNGTWQVFDTPLSCDGLAGLADATVGEGMAARVPGEIHLDLMRAGRMPEPLYSLNTKDCRWPEERAWWYTTVVRVPAAFLREERQELIFDGLDYYAQVYLNGDTLGEAQNAFIPAVFDVTGRLHAGENSLVVRLTAGTELTLDKPFPEGHKQPEGIYGHRDYHQRRWLRKPQFSYGWDWAEALPNVGIWRGVRVEGRSHAVIDDLRLDTVMRDGRVSVRLDAMLENLHPFSERPAAVMLTLTAPDGAVITRDYPLDLQAGRSPLRDEIPVPDARLWWPNGMGEQPLYRVDAVVRHGARVCDRRAFAIGLRTVEIDRAHLAEGSRFCVRVNGQDVFCKGGNWVPADSIPARIGAKKYEALVAAAKDAHFTMLRVWGGGIYEDPAFYDACDRAGILVWQDFMFACKLYPDRDPGFRTAVRKEALAVVRSLRHHPCIALWSGNNENLWAFHEWWTTQPDNYDGRIIYGQILPDVCRALDPERPYWPSSPAGGTAPNGETAGDCHWWTYGQHQDDFPLLHEVFDTCRARFISEYGMIGPVHPDSMTQFLKPDERRRDALAFQVHTNTSTDRPVDKAIRQLYTEPEGLPIADFIRYGQMGQALFYGGSVEAFRFRRYDSKDDCQGAIIWMYNDCWGEMGWTPIDYYLRRKASYYWLKRAMQPVKAIIRRRGRALVTRVVNDTRETYRATLRCGWLRLDGTRQRLREEIIDIPANGMIEVARETCRLDPQAWVYAALLSGDVEDQASYLLRPPRDLRLPEPVIRVEVDGRDICLSSHVYCHAVFAEDGGRGLLSDNYFDLLPGVPKRIRYTGDGDPRLLHFRPVYMKG
jgi:beta-mannosidase